MVPRVESWEAVATLPISACLQNEQANFAARCYTNQRYKFAVQISVDSMPIRSIKIAQLMLGNFYGTPGWDRTNGLRLRSPLLYPLSYRGVPGHYNRGKEGR
jgi:hypothetical protein